MSDVALRLPVSFFVQTWQNFFWLQNIVCLAYFRCAFWSLLELNFIWEIMLVHLRHQRNVLSLLKFLDVLVVARAFDLVLGKVVLSFVVQTIKQTLSLKSCVQTERRSYFERSLPLSPWTCLDRFWCVHRVLFKCLTYLVGIWSRLTESKWFRRDLFGLGNLYQLNRWRQLVCKIRLRSFWHLKE